MIPQLETTNVFERNFFSPKSKRIKINRGGTRSSKTYSLAQLFVVWLLTGIIRQDKETKEVEYIKKGVATVTRKTFPALRTTAMKDFLDVLHDSETYNLVGHSKTFNTFAYEGRTVEFISADNEQKVRGKGQALLWCTEGNELSYDLEYFQLFIRTTHYTFIDFNPSDEMTWINQELELKRLPDLNDVDVIVSTHRDNQFLAKTLHDEIEYLIKTNPSYYEIYGKGLYGKLEGLIYVNFKIVEYSDIAHIPVNSMGLDFGYTHPCALIETRIVGNKLYWHEIIHESRLTNPDLIDALNVLDVSKEIEIIADSAEPKSIEDLFRAGFNVHPCTKGADSVKHGIDNVLGYELHITRSSISTLKEIRGYVWALDKEGNPLKAPVKKNDDGMDAGRYSIDKEKFASLITLI